jgi:hypothetical protein
MAVEPDEYEVVYVAGLATADVGNELYVGRICVVGTTKVGMAVIVAAGVTACTASVSAAAVYTFSSATSGVAEAVPAQAESMEAIKISTENFE